MISPQQFERVQRLALKLAGIELVDRHRLLLERRSKRLGIHSTADFEALLNAVTAGKADEIQAFLSLLTTTFTSFFRQPQHFELAAEQAVRAVQHRGQARFWSAGSATGEEPYSLAMTLIEAFGDNFPLASVLATDIHAEALEFARRGIYADAAVRGLAASRRDHFFEKTEAGRKWRITPAARSLVAFRELNLVQFELSDLTTLVNSITATQKKLKGVNIKHEASSPKPRRAIPASAEGLFDVIFCRNVLMYLEACCRYSVLESMAALLAPDGLLMLDPAENLGKASHLFNEKGSGVYTRRKPSPAAHVKITPPGRIHTHHQRRCESARFASFVS
jgi:chemotaxis protein methyltransferase CheR